MGAGYRKLGGVTRAEEGRRGGWARAQCHLRRHRWLFFVRGELGLLDDEIEAGPIVDDPGSLTGIATLGYRFGAPPSR